MPFITISSSDRDSGTDTNFSIVSTSQLRDARGVRLKQATLYRSYYNVTDGTTASAKNNQFSFSVATDTNSPTDYLISIPMGEYTDDALQAALQSAINTVLTGGLTCTVGINSLLSKFTFTLSDGTKYLRVNPLPPTQGLNLMLGFSRTNYTSWVQGTLTAPRVYNLSRYLNFYIISNLVTDSTYCSALSNHACVLGSIPITADYGGVIDFQDEETSPMRLPRSFTKMEFRLIDDLGNGVDLNGTLINLVLEIT